MTADKHALAGVRVLVTRAADQQSHFINLLEERGATALSLPLLKIAPAADAERVIATLRSNAPYDFALFVSPNAVRQAHSLLPMPWPAALVRAQVAVGKATADALAAAGRAADLRPDQQFCTEGLLATDALRDVAGKRIALLCGDKGRKVLRNTLRERGAQVDELIVYQSSAPHYSEDHVCALLQSSKPDVICLTSNQALENLLQLSDKSCHASLLQTPLIVNSHRCSTLARQKGFRGAIVIANTPGDQGQLAGLLQWYTNSHVNHSE
ncbi:uroporphyrinogen-III synthase [Granulosicoccaceae sp. 1_MG-2023]|nr:uroporphyrinogen-III synthase [Granulosicoccaceae sp. 1_MG-2023]